MGTRAVIKWQDKPMLATHWDGNPSSLGAELTQIKTTTPEKVIKVASGHNIDLIAPEFAPKKPLKIPREVYYVSKKAKKEGKMGERLKGTLITKFLPSSKIPEDSGTAYTKGKTEYKLAEVLPMSKYSDFAEWEYNIDDGEVYARKINDEYTKVKPKSVWTKLSTPEEAKKFEEQIQQQETLEYEHREIEDAKKQPAEDSVKSIMLEMSSGYTWMGDHKKTYPTDMTYKDKLDDTNKRMIYNYLKIPKVKSLVNKGKGWHYESLRHKLASYGIKTNFAKGNMAKLNSMYMKARRIR